jgi:hypothetical protein
MLFKKLFQVLVVGGAVASVQAGCATGSSAKSNDAPAATREGSTADDGKAAADKPKEPAASSASGSGVSGW